MAWRAAGNIGRGGSPLNLFFPPCCFKPAILEESVGDHHERMTEKAVPGSVLEVIEINALPFRGRVRLQLDAVMGRAPSERVKVAVPR